MTQLLDYHGYGNSRLTSGTATAKKTFIGQYADTETSLSYLNARYYDPARGQFLSEDSVFLGMGTDAKMLNQLLTDPQLQNSYSYARDNPITLKDADGKFAFSDLAGYALHPVHSFNRYVAIPAAMAVLNYLNTPFNSKNLVSNMVGSFVPGKGAVQLAKPIVGAVESVGKEAIQQGGYTVYQSIKNGVVEYVGITTNFARREAEHLANGRRIEQINGLSNITRNAARGAEQLLIDHYGLGKNGGVLSNIINSISRLNPNYQKYIDSGKQALENVGIKVKL